ncbi:hypothetical protein C0Q70_09091 [Pomacea canaliculata]|uniref:Uncharacterized protein n=1 Tax=Pomacea canaliculata TaxID=400727 RepID=A0A2T7P8U4_POMCA|nr:hypothetical protein C0Q70_09091 [Pomacea canaliculata]
MMRQHQAPGASGRDTHCSVNNNTAKTSASSCGTRVDRNELTSIPDMLFAKMDKLERLFYHYNNSRTRQLVLNARDSVGGSARGGNKVGGSGSPLHIVKIASSQGLQRARGDVRQGGRKVNIGREENSLSTNMSYTSEPITTFGNGRLVNVHSL